MDRLKFIVASAERTAIMKHIEKFNVIKCKPMNARISKAACEQNCARAYLTKKSLKGNAQGVRVRFLNACIGCSRYKRPPAHRLAEVINTDRHDFKRRRCLNEKGSLPGAPPLERPFAELYDSADTLTPLDVEGGSKDEADKGEFTETAQSTDIFDVGIPVEIDEI